jgi:hypothetical protein
MCHDPMFRIGLKLAVSPRCVAGLRVTAGVQRPPEDVQRLVHGDPVPRVTFDHPRHRSWNAVASLRRHHAL